MAQTFFFYDLETSGFSPRADRIMQFGGIRTTTDLRPIGDPVDILIALAPDVVPSPDAVLVTGITPQKTLQDGITEAEFVRIFTEQIATPDTTFVGFNSLRFDDEFMRFLLYRNYVDAYEWQWKNGCSRWDLLDVVRMTRALRPDGVKWPVDVEGKPGNRLEMLTSINGLDHDNAHDALSDVRATIALAQLLHRKQPKLFEYLLKMRDKKQVAAFLAEESTFVYTSGKYPAEYEKTTIGYKLADHPNKQGVLVYDLRHDPTPFLALPPEKIAAAWQWNPDPKAPRLPVKTLRYNRCPAVAPMGVLDDKSRERLQLDMKQIEAHKQTLQSKQQEFVDTLRAALKILDKQQQTRLMEDAASADQQLYEEFIDDQDRQTMRKLQTAKPETLSGYKDTFRDSRLKAMLPLYIARNFPNTLSDDERNIWQQHTQHKLAQTLPSYFERIDALTNQANTSNQDKFLLEELRLYGESLLP